MPLTTRLRNFAALPLSDRFTVGEACTTENAAFVAAQLETFAASPEAIINAARFAWSVAEPLRSWYGAPVVFNSWFRSKALNDSLPGSSKTSLHLVALAADFNPDPTRLAASWDFLNALPAVGELIIYVTDKGKGKRLHISARGPGANGDRFVKYPDGKTVAATPVLLDRAFA